MAKRLLRRKMEDILEYRFVFQTRIWGKEDQGLGVVGKKRNNAEANSFPSLCN